MYIYMMYYNGGEKFDRKEQELGYCCVNWISSELGGVGNNGDDDGDDNASK